MSEKNREHSQELTEHFFRSEYGKLVAVITKYMGTANIHTAEDIVQETLLKAVDFWQHHAIPKNPQAWLYTTAKNLALNSLKRSKYSADYLNSAPQRRIQLENWQYSEEQIADEQLKMMFICCHPKISERSQICLILKILCGFSISEIASAFFSSTETINKRLVRGRKQLRTNQLRFELPIDLLKKLPTVLRAIFLIFNEGYSPTQKNEVIRYDLCLEAIRLCKILTGSAAIDEKSACYALLALMQFNAARFKSRMNAANVMVEMHEQDRKGYSQALINQGIYNLELAMAENQVSTYLILATISAHHCTAPSFDKTDWDEILSLYDDLIALEDTPISRLNRSVALAKVKGNTLAISELNRLEKETEIGANYHFHATLAEFYKLENKSQMAKSRYEKALALTKNERDKAVLQKKLMEVVPK